MPAAEIVAGRHPRLTLRVPASARPPPPRRPPAMRRLSTASTRRARRRRGRYSHDLADSIRPYKTVTPRQLDRIGDDGTHQPHVRTRTTRKVAICGDCHGRRAACPRPGDDCPPPDRQRRRLRVRDRRERRDRRGARERHPHEYQPNGRLARGRARRRAGARAPRALGRSPLCRGRPRDRRARPRRSHVRGPARALPRADRVRSDARRLAPPRPYEPDDDVRAAGRAAWRAAPRRRPRSLRRRLLRPAAPGGGRARTGAGALPVGAASRRRPRPPASPSSAAIRHG